MKLKIKVWGGLIAILQVVGTTARDLGRRCESVKTREHICVAHVPAAIRGLRRHLATSNAAILCRISCSSLQSDWIASSSSRFLAEIVSSFSLSALLLTSSHSLACDVHEIRPARQTR